MKYKKLVNSPIRWAGSKKKILTEILNEFVPNKKYYFEPFIGSAIVLINVINNNEYLKYENFIVNDINPHIIGFYKMLQKNPTYLINEIKKVIDEYNSKDYDAQQEYYYTLRDKFNNISNSDEKSVIFYFLMKSGFNGVYRENRDGQFNVPFGKKKFLSVDTENLNFVSKLIKNVQFYNCDYFEFFKIIKSKNGYKDSFMYCDPPYLPDDLIINQNQRLYTKNSFNHSEFFKNVVSIGLKYIMISMSSSKIADSIYNGSTFSKKNVGDILRIINPKKKFPSTEIIYINYENEKVKEK